jgi:hypothetical protein
MFSGFADDVKIEKCSGIIKSNFDTLDIDATWDIDMPYVIPGTTKSVLQKIQEQICYDAFTSHTVAKSRGKSANVVPWKADSAQLYVFQVALQKVAEQEESFSARSFDFKATLKVNFVTEGYIGYTLKGYANEGGNGCHSYTTARVLSLTTGKHLVETDFILTNKLMELRNFIIKKEGGPDVETYIRSEGTFFGEGTFILEPKGIRWYIPPYSIYPGCAGVVDVLVTWDELKPYFVSKKYLDQFRKFHLTYKKIKRTKDLE